MFNIRDVTNPAVVPQLAKFPSPAFQRNDSDLKRNERKLLILEQLRVLRRPEGEVPEDDSAKDAQGVALYEPAFVAAG